MNHSPQLSIDRLSAYVREVFPEADGYGWRVRALEPGRIEIAMDAEARHLRPGGTVSGPTLFALADLTAYMLILAHIGEVALAVTTSLNINFLSKANPGGLSATGRLVKLGKRLAVTEIHIHSAESDQMVAQATATYSIPPR